MTLSGVPAAPRMAASAFSGCPIDRKYCAVSCGVAQREKSGTFGTSASGEYSGVKLTIVRMVKDSYRAIIINVLYFTRKKKLENITNWILLVP